MGMDPNMVGGELLKQAVDLADNWEHNRAQHNRAPILSLLRLKGVHMPLAFGARDYQIPRMLSWDLLPQKPVLIPVRKSRKSPGHQRETHHTDSICLLGHRIDQFRP